MSEGVEHGETGKTIGPLGNVDEPTVVMIFDTLIPDSCSCSDGCGHEGCGSSLTSPNIAELETLASTVIEKYGEDKFAFELHNILETSTQEYPDIYSVARESKGEALPIIAVNGKITFKGEVPSFEEFQKQLQTT